MLTWQTTLGPEDGIYLRRFNPATTAHVPANAWGTLGSLVVRDATVYVVDWLPVKAYALADYVALGATLNLDLYAKVGDAQDAAAFLACRGDM